MNTELKKCPLFDLSCPYCLVSGECTLTYPEKECDDFWYYNQEEGEKEDEI